MVLNCYGHVALRYQNKLHADVGERIERTVQNLVSTGSLI